MNIIEYEALARRTCKDLPPVAHVEHMCMGLLGEAGEVVDGFKKHIVYGKPFDKTNIIEEVGDLTWYAVLLASTFNIPLYRLQALGKTSIPELNVASLLAITSNIGVFSINLLDEYTFNGIDGDYTSYIELWYNLHNLAAMFDFTLEQAFEANIAKLAARYGDKYTDFAATNRDLVTERTILESKT